VEMSQMNNELASQVLRLAIPTLRFQKESWDRNGCPRSMGKRQIVRGAEFPPRLPRLGNLALSRGARGGCRTVGRPAQACQLARWSWHFVDRLDRAPLQANSEAAELQKCLLCRIRWIGIIGRAQESAVSHSPHRWTADEAIKLRNRPGFETEGSVTIRAPRRLSLAVLLHPGRRHKLPLPGIHVGRLLAASVEPN